jgi:ABC-type branched-subunit amino acid transport system ATPase component
MADAAPRNGPALLQVRGLNVYYGHSHALQGVEFTIHTGILAVVGRNGMGKTTLCKTIMGLVRASSGSIRFANNDELTRLNPAQIARLGIGYVPQGRRLWRSLTVDEHLQVTPSARKGAWTIERIYDTFPRLAERKNNAGGQLSGGEQQMLAIGRALMTNPDVMLFDEATEGLAPLVVREIWWIIGAIRTTGIASLIIDRNYREVLTHTDRCVVLEKGRVVLEGRSQELARAPEKLARYLGV